MSCQRLALRKTLKYSQSRDLEGIQWILWIYTDINLRCNKRNKWHSVVTYKFITDLGAFKWSHNSVSGQIPDSYSTALINLRNCRELEYLTRYSNEYSMSTALNIRPAWSGKYIMLGSYLTGSWCMCAVVLILERRVGIHCSGQSRPSQKSSVSTQSCHPYRVF